MKNPESVLLASGGLDSTVLAYWLRSKNRNFIPLFLNYGQHCCDSELTTLKQMLDSDMLERLQVVDISAIYGASQSRMIVEADLWNESITADDLYLPYRNLLFLSIAAAFAQARGCKKVYAAFINSNHAKEIDCSSEFFQRLAGVFEDYGAVEIDMPFRDMSKSDVAKIGIDLNIGIGRTYSCQVSSSTACGVCPNCVDRLEALANISATEGENPNDSTAPKS